ncbi:hypothetical protein [Nonomuraea jabiensis]|uniref:hypothetical protein n=1 Tax=Nonomuraea jabiensis TaxID=882448 RepID=UPI00367B691C
MRTPAIANPAVLAAVSLMSRSIFWNNDGDTAGLYRGSDLKKIDGCVWGRGGISTTCQ